MVAVASSLALVPAPGGGDAASRPIEAPSSLTALAHVPAVTVLPPEAEASPPLVARVFVPLRWTRPEPAPGPVRRTIVAPPEVTAAAVVVIDDATGAVLYGLNEHQRLPPASLTKLATAILAVESARDLDVPVAIDVDSRAMPGSSVMGLLPGDEFQLRDLLYGLLLPSGNDAAIAIARYISGSEEKFVAQMNAMMDRLGLNDTVFADPHGLGGDRRYARDGFGRWRRLSPVEHYSSAYDIAMLARYALTLPDIAEAVVAPSRIAQGSRDIYLRNVNSFLRRYPGADGMKTGFTDEAGRTLAASATRDGRRVHVVLLDAPDRFNEAAALLDWVFDTWCWPGDGALGCDGPVTQTALAIEARGD